jgi:hypothetical protein
MLLALCPPPDRFGALQAMLPQHLRKSVRIPEAEEKPIREVIFHADGEDILERAREFSRTIEQQVRQLTDHMRSRMTRPGGINS